VTVILLTCGCPHIRLASAAFFILLPLYKYLFMSNAIKNAAAIKPKTMCNTAYSFPYVPYLFVRAELGPLMNVVNNLFMKLVQ
jgi:hypothetical protein